MGQGEFEYSASVDHRGVVIVKVAGLFDAQAWLKRQKELLASADPPPLHEGRPTIVDLTGFVPTESDWAGEADIVFGFLKRMGHRPGRRAMIVGENQSAGYALRFYDALASALLDVQGEMRLFRNFAEGYAWVTAAETASAGGGTD
ncbi:hypothetical protein ACFOGJ_10810 [Marinibaculum pumilum]|uniref:STAS/SEC14 domain-containing protein n=1 Tax=Marinibaculum pumilum TaxID=1766165 RepID=A0ABV7KZA2_9PROT